MLAFYKKAMTLILALLLFSGIALFWGLQQSFVSLTLLPTLQSDLNWTTVLDSDASVGGESYIELKEETFGLEFDFLISESAQYPYASLAMSFVNEQGDIQFVDLSHFQRMRFNVKCSPKNVLSIAIQTIEPEITQPEVPLTYRSPTTFFSCDENWQQLDVDLTRLKTPQWWLEMFELELSRQAYQLSQVAKITFASSAQSPTGAHSQVKLQQLELEGEDWRIFYGLLIVLVAIWIGAGFWLVKCYARALTEDLQIRLQKDRPLAGYQQLTLEPQKDKEKEAVLRYLATQYANPDLNLDAVVAATGVNRNKINELLKQELGYTFSTYLNKLRLTEAARLLQTSNEASVSEIAYSVGYSNIPYFNKLFKQEYGCTPRSFRASLQVK